RRPHDAGAGADRRTCVATRARTVRRLFRDGVRAGQHDGTGARRLSHRTLELARRVPHQCAARAVGRGLVVARPAYADETSCRLVSHTGRVNIFPKIGLTLASVALLGLAVFATSSSTAAIMALTVLVGAGLGMVMPPTQVTVQLAAGRDSLGVATATISLSRAIGGPIDVGIVGATLFAQIDRSADGSSALLHHAIEGGAAYIRPMSAQARAELV